MGVLVLMLTFLEDIMSRFTAKEIEYLQSQQLARLATIGSNGDLHVVPLGFRYNPENDTIDIGGHNFANSKKYRDALRYGRVALVVDDVLPPWRPRFVEVRGTVEAISGGGKDINSGFAPEMLRISPTRIISLGINEAMVMSDDGKVSYSSRKTA
jgi:pyridoxamine 5'-phosphate oxidase family protein